MSTCYGSKPISIRLGFRRAESEMAQDRFIYFSEVPKKEYLDQSLRDYFQTSAKVESKSDRFFITFDSRSEGTPIHRGERWIEVWIGSDCGVDVITREQDEFVNVIAGGLVKRIARQFSGRI